MLTGVRGKGTGTYKDFTSDRDFLAIKKSTARWRAQAAGRSKGQRLAKGKGLHLDQGGVMSGGVL